jgi:hypothetical protein
MKGKIINDRDWFLVSVCEQLEIVGRNKCNPNRRCTTWVNTILVRARSISEAYDKAIAGSRIGTHRYKSVSGKTCYWKILGVWSLTPIYDNIADGEELFWDDHGSMSFRKARAKCWNKRDLIKRHARGMSPAKITTKAKKVAVKKLKA